LVTGSQVFGRAFAEAYRQASKQSLRESLNAQTRQKAGGISYDEALKILDIDASKLSKEAVGKKYNYLFDVNAKEKAGSFYLQSKVYRAMERLTYELDQKVAKEASTTKPS
jgi:import inner membrane translocase subunit TIM16